MKAKYVCLVFLAFLLVSCGIVQSMQIPGTGTTPVAAIPSATCTLTTMPTPIPTNTSTPIPTVIPTATPDPIPPGITKMGLFMWKLAKDLGVSLVVAGEDDTGEVLCKGDYLQDMYCFPGQWGEKSICKNYHGGFFAAGKSSRLFFDHRSICI